MADSPDTGAGVCQVAVSLTDGSSGPGSDVLLRFGASNTVADLRTGLARFASARVPGLADDQPVAGGDEVGEQRLAELGIFTGVDLRVGATVSVENGWPRPGWRGDALELAVIGGLVANMLFTRLLIPVGYLVVQGRTSVAVPSPSGKGLE